MKAVVILLTVGLFSIVSLALPDGDKKPSVHADTNHAAKECLWKPGPRGAVYVGEIDGVCVRAVARNLIIGKPIKVCNSVASYDAATQAAITKWNTALNPTIGSKIVDRNILQWSTNRNCMSDDVRTEISMIVVMNEKCPGTACAVPYNIKTLNTGEIHPDRSYIGQSRIEINEMWMKKSMKSESNRRKIDPEYLDEFEANFKAAVIAHEIGHHLGIAHPKEFNSYAISGCFEGNPRKVPLMKQGGMEANCGDGNLTSLDTGYYEGIYRPNPITGLTARSPRTSQVKLNWNATNVHVEKDFEIRRCTGRKTACDAESASWTGNVKTVAANATTTTLTGQGSGWRSYRVVSRTSALTGAQAEAESTTVEVRVAAPPAPPPVILVPWCTVTVVAAEGGTASGGGTVQCGVGRVSYSSQAKPGWCVNGFSDSSRATGQALPFTICPQTGAGSTVPTENVTITATFILRSSLPRGLDEGTATATATATPTASATAAPTATATPTAAPTPTASASPTPAATPPPSGPTGQ